MAESLVILNAPTSARSAQESLDAVFAVAVFDVPLDVWFCGAAIGQLRTDSPVYCGNKSLAKQWQAAELYGIKQLLVTAADLQQQNLNKAQLIEGVTVLDKIPELAAYQRLLSL